MGMWFLSRSACSALWFNLGGLRPWLSPYIGTDLIFRQCLACRGSFVPLVLPCVQLLFLWCLVFGTRLYAYCRPVVWHLWSILVLAFGFTSAAGLLHSLSRWRFFGYTLPLAAVLWWFPGSCWLGFLPCLGGFALLTIVLVLLIADIFSVCSHWGLYFAFLTFIYSIAYISVSVKAVIQFIQI